MLYWFLNGWKYDVNGIPEVLKDIPEVKQLSAACEIAAFSPAKRTLYNRSVMKEQDVINQLYYAKEEGLAEGREEGLAEGREEGKEEMGIASIKNLIETMKITADQAMDFLKITGDERERYSKMLQS